MTEKRNLLESEIVTVKAFLRDIDQSNFLEKWSWESRLAELERELSLIQHRPEKAKARLFFDGRPVVRPGVIDAKFAGQSIEDYQDLVAKVHAQEVQGKLAGAGPVPGTDASRLLLADLLAGSCGLVFEEYREPAPVGDGQLVVPDVLQDPMARVLEITADLVSGANSDDDTFAEIASNTNPRILESLKNFLTHIDEAEATLMLEAHRKKVSLDRTSVRQSAQRVKVTSLREGFRESEGVLRGFLPDSGRFEFRLDNGDTINGKISLEETADLESTLYPVLRQHARAKFRVETATTGSRVRESFFLVNIELLL